MRAKGRDSFGRSSMASDTVRLRLDSGFKRPKHGARRVDTGRDDPCGRFARGRRILRSRAGSNRLRAPGEIAMRRVVFAGTVTQQDSELVVQVTIPVGCSQSKGLSRFTEYFVENLVREVDGFVYRPHRRDHAHMHLRLPCQPDASDHTRADVDKCPIGSRNVSIGIKHVSSPETYRAAALLFEKVGRIAVECL